MFYAVTVKIVRKTFVAATDYEPVLSALLSKQEFYGRKLERIRDVYELDSRGVIHYHGYWKLHKGQDVYYKEFNHSGCTCVIKKVYHDSGWLAYLDKQKQAEGRMKNSINDLFLISKPKGSGAPAKLDVVESVAASRRRNPTRSCTISFL